MKLFRYSIKPGRSIKQVRLLSLQGGDIYELLAKTEKMAYEKGYQDGQKSLSIQVLEQRTMMIHLKENIFSTIQAALADLIKEIEPFMIELALQIANKLVSGISITKEMVAAMVVEALAQVKETTECELYLHPEDYQLLMEIEGSLPIERIKIFPSLEVSRGGCILKSRFGTIDTRREVRIKKVKETLGIS